MKKIFKNKKLIILLSILIVGLVAFGVWSYLKSNEPIDIGHPKKGDFVKVGQMSVPRWGHETVLLDDGNVLILGGRENNQRVIDIYNSNTKKFKRIKTMNGLHGECTITKLKNGEVLIVGWSGGRTARKAELFDPKTNTFKYTGELNYFRSLHTATLLNDGRVLISGGKGGFKASEIYNPKTNKFELAPKMNIVRFRHSAILLTNGKVLIIGGVGIGPKFDLLTSVEIYDPKANTYKLVGNMHVARQKPNLYLLKNGNVLITSGIKEQDKNEGSDSVFARDIEIYNPKTNEFKIIAKRNSEALMPTEVLLKNDKLLFTGGSKGVGLSSWWYKSSEIFDPETKQFTQGKDMNFLRTGHKATLLNDGNVLISGSEGKGRTAELYIYEDKK